MSYNKEYSKSYYYKNRDRILARAKARRSAGLIDTRSYDIKRRTKDPVGKVFRDAQKRATKRGVEFTISKSDIEPRDNCPCCNRQMVVRTPYTHTLDRIDSSKGYIPGNVIILCYRCNLIKNDASPEELEMIAAFIRSITN